MLEEKRKGRENFKVHRTIKVVGLDIENGIQKEKVETQSHQN